MSKMTRATLAAMVALGALSPAAVAAAAPPASAVPSVNALPSVSALPSTSTGPAASIPAPVPRGTLRISGTFQDGATVTATGLSWQLPRLPTGVTLVSFEVAYRWQSCAPGAKGCRAAADSTATPFAARDYPIGQADAGRILRLTVTASEVVVSRGSLGDFPVSQSSVTRLATTAVRAYPLHTAPRTTFVNGTPERQTASAQEYFQVAAPHANTADGPVAQWYRIDRGGWKALPASHVFSTGKLAVGAHRVTVRTVNHAGATTVSFGWKVVPMPAPLACRSPAPGGCWYPPHLDSGHHPMRWDWQIGRVTPLQRTGRSAVDIYDVDGFLTTRAQVTAIKATWQAATLPHPRAVCYLDLAWEDYRPDASPGRYFPAAALGHVYFGFPAERWVDFRQLGALAPMLRERIAMCARKGFDAVELDDIDSFDPPSTTGFYLTPGDVENFLAYAFNEVHRYGMTALWKNSPYLSSWGRQYTDGAVVEECYVSHACFAAQFQGSRQYGLTCTAVHGATPCGWDDFSTDVTARQPTGKWVGETEYAEDDYVCDPGRKCPTAREFTTFCRAVYAPPSGFSAMKLDADLDGATFYPCPGLSTGAKIARHPRPRPGFFMIVGR